MALAAEELARSSCAWRLASMDLRIDGVPFDLRRYPYLLELFDSRASDITIRKGAQLGFTSWAVLRTIDGARHVYPRSILYLMPTAEDVSDFSKARFDRLLKENPDTLGDLIRDTDAANIKQIGETFVYFRGARLSPGASGERKSSSKLKSIPADLVVFDEFDEMEAAAVVLAQKRLDGSDLRHQIKLSTATIPEFGVDLEYSQSDQRTWHIRCEACSAWTCLELAWPDSLQRDAKGGVYRACKKCRREIHAIDGEWVAAHPSREKRGYWISQLNSPTVPPAVILDEFETLTPDSTADFYNSRLGLGYVDQEDKLDEATIRACAQEEPRRRSAQGPCYLGADIGKHLIHYVVGEKRTDDFLDHLDYGVVGDFAELHDLMQRFNVCVAVLDEMAETRSVREFKDNHGEVWGCWYSEAQRTGYDWMTKERRVAVNRTELLDQSHRRVVQQRCKLPRPDDRWPEFVRHLCNLARVRKVDRKSGTPSVRWVVVGGQKMDHWRHALAYAELAAAQCPVSEHARRIQRPRGDGFSPHSWMSA